jgi:amidohydrolase
MLLGTAKKLKEIANQIHCCVKFVFQACEEGPSGAKRICEDGFMDTVDMIIGCHIGPDKPAGTILTNKTCSNAGSHGFAIHLEGKSCHVARPQQGVDAIAMAVRVYSDIQLMRARELDPLEPVVIGIGEFHSGTAKNIVSGSAIMRGTIRTLSDATDKKVWSRIEQIAESVAKDMGGTARIEDTGYNPALVNDHNLADYIIEAATKVVGEDMVQEKPISMGAEDFSHYTYRKPGAMFCLGVMPEDGKFVPLHNSKLMVNEDVLDVTPNVFIQFVLDQMDK